MTSSAKNVNPEYMKLRSSLLDAGYTISSWARENGYPVTTVFDAAKGNRSGLISRTIRRKLKLLLK